MLTQVGRGNISHTQEEGIGTPSNYLEVRRKKILGCWRSYTKAVLDSFRCVSVS